MVKTCIPIYTNVFISYQTTYRTSTKSNTTQVQQPPHLLTAKGNLYTKYSLCFSTRGLLMPVTEGLSLSAEMASAAGYFLG